jgi:putative phosphoesterase
MLLGVISDTHGQLESTEEAVRIMQRRGVQEVIHCGDVGSSAIVTAFNPVSAHFVAGNCDSAIRLQMAVEAAGQRFHGRVGELYLESRKIAFLHGDSHLAMQRLLAEAAWDLVCHGHTHLAESYTIGQTLILNPGAMARCRQPSFAIVRLPGLQVTPITL